MGQKKISALDVAANIGLADLLAIVQGGDTMQVTWKKILATGILNLKGTDTATNINALGTMQAGDVWLVTVAGTINSQRALAGDAAIYWASAWYVISTGGGKVTGPASAIDSRVAVYDGVTGVLVKDGGQTLADLKADLTKYSNLNGIQGALINGQISVTLSTHDLVVAIKTMAGADPTAATPVYVRIDNAVYAITAALSVTAAAGTNWFNSSAASFTGLEQDYFCYLGHNTTDGVVIGFARIPWANAYSDFSAASTNDNFCKISTIANAAAGDVYCVIGRFGAILTTGTNYWTLGTLTLNYPIRETRFMNFIPQWTNYTRSNGTYVANYKIIGRMCFMYIKEILGSSSSVSGAITLTAFPITSATYVSNSPLGSVLMNNNSTITYTGVIDSGGVIHQQTVTTYTALGTTSSTQPFTWATSYFFSIQSWYEMV